jgi:hypothetical protein
LRDLRELRVRLLCGHLLGGQAKLLDLLLIGAYSHIGNVLGELADRFQEIVVKI